MGIVGAPEGKATVAAYSVLHGRDGSPERALLVCDLPPGGRCYALLDGGAAALAGAESARAGRAHGHPDAAGPGQPGVVGLRPPAAVGVGLEQAPVVGGIDGCRAGWVLATVPAHDGGAPEVSVLPDLGAVIADVASCRLLAAGIDVPIGLAAREPPGL